MYICIHLYIRMIYIYIHIVKMYLYSGVFLLLDLAARDGGGSSQPLRFLLRCFPMITDDN